jgi:hypothetical protein
MCQNQTEFEFNDHLLVDLIDAYLGATDGTFLLNSERERTRADLQSRAPCVWMYDAPVGSD